MRRLWVLGWVLTSGCGAKSTGSDGDSGPAEPAAPLVESVGCDAIPLYDRPADPSARGPWPVGTHSVTIGHLNVEILYPATPGSEAGQAPLEVDIRYALPQSERDKVGDEVRPHQSCDCYPDLPVDEAHGPYPLVLFVHGTASWRTQSLSLMEHWASRGFIVAAADHPGLWLSDILGTVCGLPTSGSQDMVGDLQTVLAGFSDGDPAVSFLGDRVDLSRVAVAGHSAGANAATAAADLDGVQVVVSMAGSGPTDVSGLSAALFMGGMADTVVPFSQTQSAYEQSVPARRLLGIGQGAHLVFSDICELTNDEGQDLVEIATEAEVCGTQFASFLFDCEASTIPAADARAIIAGASTWELETHLHCDDSLAEPDDFGEQSEWVEVLEESAAQ